MAGRATERSTTSSCLWSNARVRSSSGVAIAKRPVFPISAHALFSFCSYVGPFTKVFRDQLMGQEFLPFLRKEFQVRDDLYGKALQRVRRVSSRVSIALRNDVAIPAIPVFMLTVHTMCNVLGCCWRGRISSNVCGSRPHQDSHH